MVVSLERFRERSKFSCIGDTGKALGGGGAYTVSEERAVGLGWKKGGGFRGRQNLESVSLWIAPRNKHETAL